MACGSYNVIVMMSDMLPAQFNIGKRRALSLEVTCNVSLYYKIGRTRVESTDYS